MVCSVHSVLIAFFKCISGHSDQPGSGFELSSKEIAMQTWRRILGALLLGVFLTACGGGGTGSTQVVEQVTAFGDTSRAVVSNTTLNGRALNGTREKALAVKSAPTITAEQLIFWAQDWAAAQTPPLTLFAPKCSVVTRGEFEGTTYDFCFYSVSNAYLGVDVGNDRGVYTFVDNVLTKFGNLSDYTCDVDPSQCGGGNSVAGTFDVSAASQIILPNYVNGKITYLGAVDKKSYDITLGQTAKVCWVSNRKGWGIDAQACAVPAVDGTLKPAGMCSNDRGLVTVWRNDRTKPEEAELWLDFTSAKGWRLAGDLSPAYVGGFIEYGGYQSAKVTYQKEGGKLTVRFGSDCLGGFVYEQTPGVWKLASLVPGDMRFIWNGQTKQEAFLTWDDTTKEYVVAFTGIPCGEQANVSLYKVKSKTGDVVVWEDSPYAWLGIPEPKDPTKPDTMNPLWEQGAGMSFLVKKLLNKDERSIVLSCS